MKPNIGSGVPLDMTRRTADETNLQRLRKDYDSAYGQWAQRVRHLQLLSSDPTSKHFAIDEARYRMETANGIYRECRDLLAEFILADSDKRTLPVRAPHL